MMSRFLRSVLVLALVAAVGLVPAGSVAAAPGAPEAVPEVKVARADGTLTASWPGVAGASSYHVTYSSDGAASWSLAALDHPAASNTDVDSGMVSITIEDVDNDASYIVGVRARNEHGGSGWRNSPSVGPYVAPPAAPAGLAAAAGDGSVTLSWDDPFDPAITGYEYQVRYAGVAWGEWEAVAGSGSATVSHAVEGLDNGTEYRFKVRAVNAGGAGKAAPSAPPWYVAAVPQAPRLRRQRLRGWPRRPVMGVWC